MRERLNDSAMNSRLCFATLAFGKSYRDMAKLLASDLAAFAPDHSLVIATDAVEEFKGCANVIAYPQRRTGFFRCINDKRFAVLFALDNHAQEAVFIDADTRIRQNLPTQVGSDAKIVTVYTPLLAEHAHQWLEPRRARAVIAAARSFGIDPGGTKFIMDYIFAVKSDKGREKIFVQIWDMVTRLFDFEGVSIADGYCMSIAAAVAGWVPSDTGLEPFAQAIDHAQASTLSKKPKLLTRAVRRGVQWSQLMLHRQQVIRSIKIPASIS